MEKKTWNEIWSVILVLSIGIGATLPAFLSDFYSGHDALTHLNWSRNFAAQFWSGDLYPRWLTAMNDGMGSPSFYYYFPLPYFVTSLFHAPVLQLGSNGWLQLGLACTVAATMSGLTCLIWLRTQTGPIPALCGAVLFMLLPYHMLVDLYYRFAFTEFWSFVFMPLCLFFVVRTANGYRTGIPGLALSYALLLLAHLPSALIFSAVPPVYATIVGRQGTRLQSSLKIIAAMVLGAGIAAFYWIPALITQKNVQFSDMSRGSLHYENYFLLSKVGDTLVDTDGYLSYLSTVTLLTCAGAIFFWLAIGSRKFKREPVFWVVASSLALFMMLEISTLAWQASHVLQRIQFPYRFNLLLALALPALVAGAVEEILRRRVSRFGRLLAIGAATFFLSQAASTGATVFKRATGAWDTAHIADIDRELSLKPDVPEYLPIWANKAYFPVTAGRNPLAEIPKAGITEGRGEVTVLSWNSQEIILHIEGLTDILLTVRQLFYPTWNAYLSTTEGEEKLETFPSATEGLLSLRIPTGSHRLLLKIEKSTEERLGHAISLTSLTLLALFVTVAAFHWKKKGLSP